MYRQAYTHTHTHTQHSIVLEGVCVCVFVCALREWHLHMIGGGKCLATGGENYSKQIWVTVSVTEHSVLVDGTTQLTPGVFPHGGELQLSWGV